MKKQILLFVFLCLGILGYSQTWVSFSGSSTPSEPDLNVVTSTKQQIDINCHLAGMNSQTVPVGLTTYQRISIPQTTNTVNVGFPEVPVISRAIAIPECSGYNISVTVINEIILSNYTIYPSPQVNEEIIDDKLQLSELFQINQTAYSTNAYFPQDIDNITEDGFLRDQRYLRFTFNPIQFNPVTHSLRVITDCRITFQFTNPTTNVNVPTGLFNKVSHNSFLNYPGDGKSASSTGPSENSSVTWFQLTDVNQLDNLAFDYLIITSNQFWDPNNQDSEIRRLAIHRASTMGFAVGIINVDNILNDATGILPYSYVEPQYFREQKIRNAIKRVYENSLAPNTFDHHLAYVLVVGDAHYNVNVNTSYGVPSSHDPSVVPYSQSLNNYPSDNYYTLLTLDSQDEFDPYSDIYIGRFPVNNNTELHNMVEKTIIFETEFSGGFFHNKALFSNCKDPEVYDYVAHPLGVYQDLLPAIITPPYTYTILDEQVNGIGTWYDVIEELNEGDFMFEYYGHSHADRLDYFNHEITTADFQSLLTNEYKNPFFVANSCYAGAFDNSHFDTECLAEELARYSGTKGFVGSYASSSYIPLNTSTPDGIWPKSTFDAIPYYLFEEISSITGEFILQNKTLQENLYGLPNYFHKANFMFNYFGDPALNLMANGYQITHDITISGVTTISNDVHVCSGATLTLSGIVNFTKEGRLFIDKGGELVLHGCTFNGVDAYNAVEVNGSITVSTQNEQAGIAFIAAEDKVFTGLILNNPYINVTFPMLTLNEAAVFGNDLTSFKVGTVGKARSQFISSALYFQAGDIEINQTDFSGGTYANLRNTYIGSSAAVKVTNCTFSGNNGEAFIKIQDYAGFSIENNTINFGRYDAINLYNSGFSTQIPHIINNNTINYTGTTYSLNNCIKVYQSQVDITNNIISNASYGISCLNNSNVKIRGNCSAPNASSTQQIINNRDNQIFADERDYPYDIKFNHIDNTINTNPLVYFNAKYVPLNPYLDITCNHWGLPFTPNTELYPFGKYIYNPQWNFNNCFCGNKEAEEKFNSAIDAEKTGDYRTAELGFKYIIENHSETEYAAASVNELYSIYKAQNDLSNLQTYLNSIPMESTKLSNRAAFISNWANIEQGKYSEAIKWFEKQLTEPLSLEDSVFAIIDLNYTILRSQSDSLKSAPISKFSESLAKNHVDFNKNRLELIDLLYPVKDQHTMAPIQNPIELKIYPNPVTTTLNILISSLSGEELNGKLTLCDQLGKSILEFEKISVAYGDNSYSFELPKLIPGVYYLKLINNNTVVSSAKMVVLP